MIAKGKNGSCHRENIIQRKTCSRVRNEVVMRQHIRASLRLRASLQRVASGVYQIPPAAILAWQATCDEVLPIVGEGVGR
jgi:hypothetical protein